MDDDVTVLHETNIDRAASQRFRRNLHARARRLKKEAAKRKASNPAPNTAASKQKQQNLA